MSTLPVTPVTCRSGRRAASLLLSLSLLSGCGHRGDAALPAPQAAVAADLTAGLGNGVNL